MADDNGITSTAGGLAGALNPTQGTTAAQAPSKQPVKKKNELGEEDFLKLLVHQLEHQDPLDPMKSEEFAVQLAQFSSLEQLVAINKKLDASTSGPGSVSSMASFLGHGVALKDQTVELAAGQGPQLMITTTGGALSGRVDFVDSDGRVVGSHNFEQLAPGKQFIQLNGVRVPNGSYDVRVSIVDPAGRFQEVEAKVAGTVEGFVLEPEPALLVNGREVKMDDVAEVFKTPT